VSETPDPGEALAIARHALEVARHIDLPAAAAAYVRAAAAHAPCATGLLYLYDAEADVFRLVGSTLDPADPRAEAIATLELAGLRASGAAEPFVAGAPAGLRGIVPGTVLAAPVLDGARLVAYLVLADPAAAWDEAAIQRTARLLPEMVTGLLNARQVETFRELVIKDDQTECFNRRYFDRCLSEEIYRARRYAQPLAVVFLDLDNLREINARFGHAVGSRTVREVARRLVGGIRGSDRSFRYGGDEFCLVLPATELGGALELCERLRSAIAGRPFVADIGTHVNVTASFGIASYPEHARTSLGLVKCADEAMQRAKREGKDSVRVAATPEPGAQTAARPAKETA
jgi:diguanylate cyclase (GGDEF)-like protein